MLELPLFPTLESARLAVEECRACPRCTTRDQVVFGLGNPNASLMLVGEAPSPTDNSTGKPFTGPAGRLLDTLLEEAGIHRRHLWITNLVRCFDGALKNGRMENRPVKASEANACRTWLDLEIRYVNPAVILAIGAPAARRIIGSQFRLSEQHGQLIQIDNGRLAVATIQPAYVMRLATINPDAQAAARAQIVDDIRVAARAAGLVGDG
ncbi:MAG TPA: uracil-DNA glycosylase [Thermomicrobiales bacterium]|nr:uracil-DNA glycosylase [Thermomicrobiales bacterium]